MQIRRPHVSKQIAVVLDLGKSGQGRKPLSSEKIPYLQLWPRKKRDSWPEEVMKRENSHHKSNLMAYEHTGGFGTKATQSFQIIC